MAGEGLKALYIDELKDLYNAENQLIKALPKMAKAAAAADLWGGFEKHLEQTRGHVERLDAIFKSLEENPKGKTCKGMEGLISEGSEAIEEYENAVRDAALIGAAQRVEHYKIAAYGAVIAIALQLGETKRADTLDKTLKEEKETDARLTAISQTVNAKAEGQNDGEGISEPKATKKSSKHRAPWLPAKAVAGVFLDKYSATKSKKGTVEFQKHPVYPRWGFLCADHFYVTAAAHREFSTTTCTVPCRRERLLQIKHSCSRRAILLIRGAVTDNSILPAFYTLRWNGRFHWPIISRRWTNISWIWIGARWTGASLQYLLWREDPDRNCCDPHWRKKAEHFGTDGAETLSTAESRPNSPGVLSNPLTRLKLFECRRDMNLKDIKQTLASIDAEIVLLRERAIQSGRLSPSRSRRGRRTVPARAKSVEGQSSRMSNLKDRK